MSYSPDTDDITMAIDYVMQQFHPKRIYPSLEQGTEFYLLKFSGFIKNKMI